MILIKSLSQLNDNVGMLIDANSVAYVLFVSGFVEYRDFSVPEKALEDLLVVDSWNAPECFNASPDFVTSSPTLVAYYRDMPFQKFIYPTAIEEELIQAYPS